MQADKLAGRRRRRKQVLLGDWGRASVLYVDGQRDFH